MVTFGFLYQYYDAAVSARRLAGVKLESGVTLNSLRGAGLLNSFMLDFAIMIPQPLPGLSRTITLKEESYYLDSLLVLSVLLALLVCQSTNTDAADRCSVWRCLYAPPTSLLYWYVKYKY